MGDLHERHECMGCEILGLMGLLSFCFHMCLAEIGF